MANIKSKLSKIAVKINLYLVLLHAHAVLANPFDKAEDKGNEIIDLLSGSLGVVIVALAVAFASLSAIFNWLEKKTALKIAVGGIVLGSCVQIAEWIVN